MKRSLFSRGILLSLALALLIVQSASGVAGVWTPTGSMTTARGGHTATLLPDGQVLVVGGGDGHYLLASAELYDPTTGTWTAIGSMEMPRVSHTATLLADGKVLVSGGYNYDGALARAELYDPATSLWRSAGAMGAARYNHTATLLANGKVLVVGGWWAPASAELYDPATDTWSPTGSLNTPRKNHAAVRLLDGKVLVMGGNHPRVTLQSAELYNPATGTWTETGSLATARRFHTATLLSDGTVLAVGGYGYYNNSVLSSVELYDPATGVWTETGRLGSARGSHTAMLLPLAGGKVLAAGGENLIERTLSSAELYDPATGTWTGTGSMGTARYGHRAVLLQNSKVLAIGGSSASGVLASAELYMSTQLLQTRSSSLQDGWVLETSETSSQGGLTNAIAGTFIVGDNAGNRQYRSILGFNTSSLPDNALITSVMLKIKKHSVTGTDPFTTHGWLVADIRQGPFYRNALQSVDFDAAASQPAAGMFPSTPLSGDWYVADLKPAAYPFINRTGVTQFRLRFKIDDDNDRVADFLRFYSGDAAAGNRPVLVVEYDVP